ncbi:4'-phosphopantetheinyl transferase [Pseudoduganella flava]|uniref:4'-phosphopantetheinyl transferase n=1 Tax=Pseudoduganella flava TaxID=871742 RepID=A0A562PTG5_9BURK|nr:4'-phosphopantetheinyl transferase superfamily protein [Pseudoduganella flava]QGZ39036.1 4-phosphopantetheinyl transferase [Pseudoduganella flava]TWI47699.1 4'-phosphopantetheinyl transferase [Pseudoduganella flava]
MTQAAAHVWLADIGALDEARLDLYWQWLSDSERAREFARPQRRRQFIAARALLRIAAGDLLGLPPAAVVFGGQAGRAPWLVSPAVALPGLSVSHSGDWVACALSTETALGLDIEVKEAGRDVDALAEHAFDAATCARLAALAPGERLHEFYAAWSAQEARIKLGMDAVNLEAAACVAVAHDVLAIALCAAQPLAAPVVHVAAL